MPGPSEGATCLRGGRFGILPLAVCTFLAGCGDTGSVDPDSPWAPGVARDEQAVDGMLVGHRLMRAGEYELAIDAFERAAVTQGLTADVLLGIGSASLGLGRLHTAETLLRDALDQDERSPEIWNNLGVVLMELGETAEASQSFQRAYALDNGASDSIRDNLRLALEKLENPGYNDEQEQNYKLVRRGSNDFLIRSIP
ncbi:MAG: tetratricopeptide repeat protein [Pseudomonadota bacterium]